VEYECVSPHPQEPFCKNAYVPILIQFCPKPANYAFTLYYLCGSCNSALWRFTVICYEGRQTDAFTRFYKKELKVDMSCDLDGDMIGPPQLIHLTKKY
jgi:hypothetical protein